MTRFDADTPEDRQKLFAEAIAAHRERASAFATIEAHEDASGADVPPWVQFGEGFSSEGGEDGERSGPERSGGLVNLDCTDAELDDLKSLLGEFPAFKIDDITRPEETDGVNVRVSALADTNRVAQFVERIFRDVYGQSEDYRAWVTAV